MTTHSTTRRRRLGASIVVLATFLAACGSGDDESDDATTEAEESADDETADDETAAGDLETCPSTVTFQLDWEPEAEHGPIYQMLGDGYEIDADNKIVTGPLMDGDTETGLDIEIRIGGAPIGFQAAETILYSDDSVLFGFGRVAEMVSTNADLPTTAVFATMDKSPYSVYWDPETYPEVESIADLGEQGVTILAGSGADVWIDYLSENGIVDASLFDTSNIDKPATFIAAGGEVAEAGFATAEPFLYEVEVAEEWGRPVAVQLLDDTGFREYFQAVTVKTEDIEGEAECLAGMVPVMQRAAAAYLDDPAPVLELVVELVEAYDTGWVYTVESGEFAFEQMLELGIMGDGGDGTIGDFDADRVDELIGIVADVRGTDVSELTAEDIATNQFIDSSIGSGK